MRRGALRIRLSTAWYPNTVSVTFHRRFFPAGDFLPGRRFAPEALPALGPFADRSDVDAFFDLADLADFASVEGLAVDLPDLRLRAPLSLSSEEVV